MASLSPGFSSRLTAYSPNGMRDVAWQPSTVTEHFSSWLQRMGHGLMMVRRVAAGNGEAAGIRGPRTINRMKGLITQLAGTGHESVYV